MLPAAEGAESIWTNKFGFNKMTQEQVCVFTCYLFCSLLLSFGLFLVMLVEYFDLWTLFGIAAEQFQKRLPDDDFPMGIDAAEVGS